MSEPTAPAAPAASSEPTIESTSSIVEAAAADIRSEESAPSEPVASGTTTTTAAPTESAAPVTQAEKDELAEMLGITGDGTTKWTARVNYSKVHKAFKALREKQAAEHAAAVKQHADENASTRQQIERFDQLVANPEQLLSALASIHPAYRQYVGKVATASTPPTGTPTRIETMEDLQRVIDQQVAAKLAPIEQERQANQFIAEAVPRIKAQLAEAETWPLFKENKAEIQAAVSKLPQNLAPDAVLRMAYQSVVLPKLAANRDIVRSEVMAELKSRPHSSTVTTTVSGRGVQSPEAVDTADIVRQALAGIKD